MAHSARTILVSPRIALVSALLTTLLAAGCSDGRRDMDLYLVSFAENQRTGLFRDQVLTFEFSTAVDLATVNLDTFRIFTGEISLPVAFTGLFERHGRFLHFHPVVDEDDPGRGTTPVNPYGFDENTTYLVKIPSVNDTPRPLRVLASVQGRSNLRAFSGGFTTGADFGPDPNEGAPAFSPFAPAVFNAPGSSYRGTPEPSDDVLSYSPVPNLTTPPVSPTTNQPDFRAGHPSNVRVQLTFTEVMDPRSFRPQEGGNIRLEFNSPGTQDWNFIPTTVAHAPNGRTFILTAATPLAHALRHNKYRVVIDQKSESIRSRSGKPLVAAVEKWDDVRKRMLWVDVTEADLTVWCAKEFGESGPLLTAGFPLERFSKDASNQSDADVSFASGRLDAGLVVSRVSEDRTPCRLPGSACSFALREPFTQSASSTKPNPNTKGPSKIQFLHSTPQHGRNRGGYKLANADALTGMQWGPLCSTVVKSTYPKMHVHVMWSDRNSTTSTPAGLTSTTYNNNFDKTPPGFAVRDGNSKYTIDQSSANATWYPWKFQRPFTDYRVDKGLVFMAWSEVGGDVEQYPRWYAPDNTPNTRVFSPPSKQVNPTVGLAGQWCYYWTRFEFTRIRSLGISHYFRMTGSGADRPLYHAVVVSPTPANLPAGTAYEVEYGGARFTTYSLQGGKYWRGEGTPSGKTDWTRYLAGLNEFPAVAIRVVFTANPTRPIDRPYIDGVSFTYRLK